VLRKLLTNALAYTSAGGSVRLSPGAAGSVIKNHSYR
jgi:hypothetical protein